MAAKAETNFRKRFVPKVKAIPRTFVISVQQLSLVGTPDLLICVAGFFVAIELKKDKNAKVSPLQEYNLAMIEKAGGVGLLCYPENAEEVLEFLTMLSERGVRL